MVMSNKERVGRGLDIVLEGLRPVCVAAWEKKWGADWVEQIQQRDKAAVVGQANPDDIAWLLKGMHNTWSEVWRHRLGQAERAYTSELRKFRDDWAHNNPLNSDDTLRMLDTAERLLSAISAADQVKQIKDLKRDLQRQVVTEEGRAERRKTAAKPTEGNPLAGLAPWRTVITPHTDVATGRLQQAEFAADLYQVATGLADAEYQEPVAFFRRTYLTRGLRDLLVGAARRFAGEGGDPVIDLQTNFGGGKTHSMIALYHLASGTPVAELPGVAELLAEEKLELPSEISRAVVVGHWISPSKPSVKPDGTVTRTMWGEIAWQLAGPAGYALVAEDDERATNPGANFMEVLRLAGPSLILVDEWVAYARMLPAKEEHESSIGGPFDTQFTFAQTLTEAAAALDNVVVLVSIPSSDIEVGGEQGREALNRLSHVVRRVSKQWKPADEDESFEIVRRRLFETMTADEERVRDGVVNAFADLYRANRTDFPNEVQEAEYIRRMKLSYPIHPEFFDRLYSDWSTLDRFQRTRGVLRLMATVIAELWQREDRNLLIMPGTVPLDDHKVAAELRSYLDPAWDGVIGSDIDGPISLPLRIDEEQKHLGRYSATRRVARAVFLATAPREEAQHGIDIKRITLGSVQPGEQSGTFGDALRRLSSDATHLYVDGAQYWFSLRPNISRLAADRALSNFTDDNADDELRRRIQGIKDLGAFSALHAFPDGPGDVTDDDDGVHLVVLSPLATHIANQDSSDAITAAEAILAQRGAGPRVNRNLLIFCATGEARLAELRTGVRQHLAWKSIVDEREELNLTPNDLKQATTKLNETNETVVQRISEAFQHVLVPHQEPGHREIIWQQTKPSGNGSLAERITKKLEGEERLIPTYGGARVLMDLDRIPLWSDRRDITVADLWKAYSQFPYLPRLANIGVLKAAISNGVSNMDWAAQTFAYAEAHDGERWVGLVGGMHVDARPGGFVVARDVAKAQMDAAVGASGAGTGGGDEAGEGAGGGGDGGTGGGPGGGPGDPAVQHPTSYYGAFTLDRVRAIRQIEDLLTSLVDHLQQAEAADVQLTLEINATSAGFDDRIRRVVTENANHLGVKNQEFEG